MDPAACLGDPLNSDFCYLTLEGPDRASMDGACRDVVELVPAFLAVVAVEHGFRAGHSCLSLLGSRSRAAIRSRRGAGARRQGRVSACVNPSRSSTVTVSAEWPLRRSGDGTFSREWMHTSVFALVPNVSSSSFMDPRVPAAVHQR